MQSRDEEPGMASANTTSEKPYPRTFLVLLKKYSNSFGFVDIPLFYPTHPP